MVMVRWKRLEEEGLESAAVDAQPNESILSTPAARHSSKDLVLRLGAITKAASYLSLKSLELPVGESVTRKHLLEEFRSTVSEFYEIRTELQRSHPSPR